MRVVKEGHGTNPIIGEFECTGVGNGGGGCKALLEVQLNDLRYYEGSDYPIGRRNAYTFRCPECGTLTDLAQEDWPVGAQRERVKPFTNKWKNGESEDGGDIVAASINPAGESKFSEETIRSVDEDGNVKGMVTGGTGSRGR